MDRTGNSHEATPLPTVTPEKVQFPQSIKRPSPARWSTASPAQSLLVESPAG